MRREGVRLVLADLDADKLAATARELVARGGDAHAIPTDVRDYESCKALMRAAITTAGRVDILVNSAGIGGPLSFFAETEPRDWRDLVEINLVGVMNCCRAVLDHMIERRHGKIVSLASEAGKANEKRMVVYGATNGGGSR